MPQLAVRGAAAATCFATCVLCIALCVGMELDAEKEIDFQERVASVFEAAQPELGEGGNTTNTSSREPRLGKSQDIRWAGRWETDMGVLLLEQIDREVYGKFEERKGSIAGIVTTDPRVLIGQLTQVASTGGFKIEQGHQNDAKQAQKFAGHWWKSGSKDRLPWSGKQSFAANESQHFYGDVQIDGALRPGSVEASGTFSAARGISSATIAQPSSQSQMPYLLSGINCKWKRTAFDSACGQSGKTAASWGGFSNIKGATAQGNELTVAFNRSYAGAPFCFVSFGGAETMASYSLDAKPNTAHIFLKRKGCCAMDWSEFAEHVSLVCHGAGVR